MSFVALVVASSLALGAASTQPTCADAAKVADSSSLLQRLVEPVHHETVEIDAETVQEVENILVNLAGNNSDANSTLQDLKDGANAAQDIAGKDHDKVKKVIEEESENTSPEEELNRTGSVITAKMLRQINNRTTSPEEECSDCVEGDMKPGAAANRSMLLQLSSKGTRFVENLWKGGVVPYCFSPTIAASSKSSWLDAVQHYKDHVPCLTLKKVAVENASTKKCATQPGIFVQSDTSDCSADVGEPDYDEDSGTYDAAIVNLGADGCDDMGTAVHELGHIIGMLHENSRRDALEHVTVFWDNIKPEFKWEYAIDTNGSEGVDTTIPYDLMSVMHYEEDEFGKVGADGKAMKTMKPKVSTNRPLGNRQGLSFADVQQVASMYGCLDKVKTKSFKLCTDPSDTKTTGCSPSDCVCTQGRGSKVHKVKNGPNCYQCAEKCPIGDGVEGYCGCTEGFKKESWKEEGVTYSTCTADDDNEDDGDGDDGDDDANDEGGDEDDGDGDDGDDDDGDDDANDDGGD